MAASAQISCIEVRWKPDADKAALGRVEDLGAAVGLQLGVGAAHGLSIYSAVQ